MEENKKCIGLLWHTVNHPYWGDGNIAIPTVIFFGGDASLHPPMVDAYASHRIAGRSACDDCGMMTAADAGDQVGVAWTVLVGRDWSNASLAAATASTRMLCCTHYTATRRIFRAQCSPL